MKIYTDKPFHHMSLINDFCPQCKRQRQQYWTDEKELNGFTEPYYTFDGICMDCYAANNGVAPKTLSDIKRERMLLDSLTEKHEQL